MKILLTVLYYEPAWAYGGPPRMIFDYARQQLYITTTAGTVQRYDVNAQALLSPWTVGTQLNGADISADSSTLYVAESQTTSSTGQGVVHKVDLASGSVTNVPYALDYYEAGSWDVAVPATGQPLFDTMFAGSGWIYIRQIDPSSGSVTKRTDKGLVTQNDLTSLVIDSITSNYRVEHASNNMLALSARSSELAKLGQLLRNLAVKHDIAVVLANQVSG